MLLTFGLVMIGWVLFRADSIGEAFGYLGGIMITYNKDFFDLSFFVNSDIPKQHLIISIFAIFSTILLEWKNRHRNHGFDFKTNLFLFNFIAFSLIALIIFLCQGDSSIFIYFQF